MPRTSLAVRGDTSAVTPSDRYLTPIEPLTQLLRSREAQSPVGFKPSLEEQE